MNFSTVTPNYTPPSANFDWEESLNPPSIVGSTSSAGGKKGRKPKKKGYYFIYHVYEIF